MLNELQSQRDLTLQLNEYWLLIQDDHKKRAKQLKVTFDKNDELEKKISQLQDTQSVEQQVNQKEVSMISVLICHSEVEWSFTFEAHSQRESSTLSENENDHHKFIKLSNSLIFIETDDSI